MDAIARMPRHFIDESNPVRVIDLFVDALDLAEMSFEGVEPAATRTTPRFSFYGYLNRLQSSRRLEQEAGCNVEVMWLLAVQEHFKLYSVEPMEAYPEPCWVMHFQVVTMNQEECHEKAVYRDVGRGSGRCKHSKPLNHC